MSKKLMSQHKKAIISIRCTYYFEGEVKPGEMIDFKREMTDLLFDNADLTTVLDGKLQYCSPAYIDVSNIEVFDKRK